MFWVRNLWWRLEKEDKERVDESLAVCATGGIWNLSVGEEHKAAIVATGGIKALVDLIFRWPAGSDGVLVWSF